MKITNIKRIWNLLDPIRKGFNWSFQLSIGEKWRNQNTRNILVTAETFAQIHFSWKRWSWMKGALKDGETPFHCFFFFQFSMRNFSCYFFGKLHWQTLSKSREICDFWQKSLFQSFDGFVTEESSQQKGLEEKFHWQTLEADHFSSGHRSICCCGHKKITFISEELSL